MIFTESAFYYGVEITEDTRALPFAEGAEDFVAMLNPGRYTITDLANEAARAMNVEGTLDYQITVDRLRRTLTISGDDEFTLPITAIESSAYPVLGFTGGTKDGEISYSGELPVGAAYFPQFRLQSYVDFKDNQKSVESSVNTSASGQVEVIRFGTYKLMECEIKFITDIDQGPANQVIRTDLEGVANARRFLEYAVTKGPVEFIPDIANRSEFTKCILESTPESSIGVDFKLKEEWSRSLVGYYTTGLLTFREVN
jgi:hypothetical protein